MIKVEIGNTRSIGAPERSSNHHRIPRNEHQNNNLDKIEDHIACRSVCKYCVRIYIYIFNTIQLLKQTDIDKV